MTNPTIDVSTVNLNETIILDKFTERALLIGTKYVTKGLYYNIYKKGLTFHTIII